MSFKLLSTTIVVLLGFYTLFAHGDAHVLIQEINEKLDSDPDNPELYFNRAVLYESHNDFNAAFLDYNTAKELEPGNTFVDHNLARLCLSHRLGKLAYSFIESFLANHPDDIKGRVTRAEIYRYLGDYDASIEDYKIAINSDQAIPTNYYDLAETILERDAEAFEEAISYYRLAQQRLGDITGFRKGIILLEMQRGRTENALVEVDLLIDRSKRKESWLILKAEILEDAGRTDEAETAYQEARMAIEILSETRKNTDFIRELNAKIEMGLARN